MRIRKDVLEGKVFFVDFCLSLICGCFGLRVVWGGEIGGLKISEWVLNMSLFVVEKLMF